MDIGAFVQENRRWLIGCGIAGLVFIIAWAVIGSVYDPRPVQLQMNQLRSSNRNPDGVYGRDVLDAARAEAEQLAAEKARLQQELAFVPQAKYLLDGKGAAADYLYQVGLALKQGVINAGLERDVQIVEKEVSWPVQNGVDEIRAVLFGLELIDECTKRLFAAHDAVRKKDPEAMGLRSILACKTDSRTGPRNQARSTRPGEVVLTDYVVQERVSFKFQADAATILLFLESCRQPGRTLAIETVQMQQPERASDPVMVTGTLLGIAWKEKT